MPVEFSIKYDRLSDALYIKLRNDKVVDSDEVEPGIIVDYNDKGEIVGIEVLWFSRRKLDLSKLILKGPEALVAEV
ncbi:MAG: DUF2283 domain-containing protein [Caldisphaeraceae archaeon]|nr:DUF2283 domain-containing protein [Caldisphaeraceae archaeon]